MTPTPPPPNAAKNISYPEILESLLANGMRVMVIGERRLPRISVTLALPVGQVNNPDHNLGLLQLAVELIKEGTPSRSSREISDLMDHWAIHYESEISVENVFLSFSVLEDYLEPALDLFSDMVCHPSFPEEELEKLKVRWRSSLIAQRSQPEFLAHERIFHSLYEGHPYAKVSIPVDHLDNTRQDSLREIYRRCCLPNGSFLIFAGPIDIERAAGLANRFFGEWESQPLPSIDYPPLVDIQERSLCLIHRPHSVQSRIALAGRMVPKADPDALPLKVVNQILGGGASARLFLNLREARGYTYGAYSRLRAYRHDGIYLIEASVKADVTSESIQEALKEVEGTGKSAPSAKELSRCQAELTGAFLRQTETASSVAQMELIRRLYQLPGNYYETFIPTIRAITAEKVLQLSRRFFNPQRVMISVVADREQVESQLRRFGELRVYDTDGNPI